jgi:hypothetical protein
MAEWAAELLYLGAVQFDVAARHRRLAVLPQTGMVRRLLALARSTRQPQSHAVT